MHRLPPFEEVSRFVHLPEHADLRRLVLWQERQVRIVEVANDTVTLEASALPLDGLPRELRRPLPERDGGERLTFLRFHRLQNLQFDGQAMTVPSGYVMHLLSPQHLMSIDEILEELVEGVSYVKVAVCVRQSVVEYKSFGARFLGRIGQLRLEIGVGPVRLELRLALDRVRALAEVCLGEEDGGGIDVFGRLLRARTLSFLSYSASAPFGVQGRRRGRCRLQLWRTLPDDDTPTYRRL